MTMVLDAAALIALDRNDRSMWVRLKTLHGKGELPVTHGGIVGQVWRGGHRQARLATALAGMDVRPLDEHLGRAAGKLLAPHLFAAAANGYTMADVVRPEPAITESDLRYRSRFSGGADLRTLLHL